MSRQLHTSTEGIEDVITLEMLSQAQEKAAALSAAGASARELVDSSIALVDLLLCDLRRVSALCAGLSRKVSAYESMPGKEAQRLLLEYKDKYWKALGEREALKAKMLEERAAHEREVAGLKARIGELEGEAARKAERAGTAEALMDALLSSPAVKRKLGVRMFSDLDAAYAAMRANMRDLERTAQKEKERADHEEKMKKKAQDEAYGRTSESRKKECGHVGRRGEKKGRPHKYGGWGYVGPVISVTNDPDRLPPGAELIGAKDRRGKDHYLYIPAMLVCLRDTCNAYSLPGGEVVEASRHPLALRCGKGHLDVTLLADLLTDKLLCGTPLYSRMPFLGRWLPKLGYKTVDAAAVRLSGLMYDTLRGPMLGALKECCYLGIDEVGTRVMVVVDEKDGKRAVLVRHVWTFYNYEKNIVFHAFELGGSRSTEVLAMILGEWLGIRGNAIQADRAPMYAKVCRMYPTLKRLVCLVHVRRYFLAANKFESPNSICKQVLDLISRIYELERGYKDARLTTAEKEARRKAEADPLLDQVYALCRVGLNDPDNADRELLLEAFAYATAELDGTIRYTEEGYFMPDNSRVEQLNRCIARGRKTYLFFGSAEAARTQVFVLGAIETAKLNGHDPYAFMREAALVCENNSDPLYRLDQETLNSILPHLFVDGQGPAKFDPALELLISLSGREEGSGPLVTVNGSTRSSMTLSRPATSGAGQSDPPAADVEASAQTVPELQATGGRGRPAGQEAGPTVPPPSADTRPSGPVSTGPAATDTAAHVPGSASPSGDQPREGASEGTAAPDDVADSSTCPAGQTSGEAACQTTGMAGTDTPPSGSAPASETTDVVGQGTGVPHLTKPSREQPHEGAPAVTTTPGAMPPVNTPCLISRKPGKAPSQELHPLEGTGVETAVPLGHARIQDQGDHAGQQPEIPDLSLIGTRGSP